MFYFWLLQEKSTFLMKMKDVKILLQGIFLNFQSYVSFSHQIINPSFIQ